MTRTRHGGAKCASRPDQCINGDVCERIGPDAGKQRVPADVIELAGHVGSERCLCRWQCRGVHAVGCTAQPHRRQSGEPLLAKRAMPRRAAAAGG